MNQIDCLVVALVDGCDAVRVARFIFIRLKPFDELGVLGLFRRTVLHVVDYVSLRVHFPVLRTSLDLIIVDL